MLTKYINVVKKITLILLISSLALFNSSCSSLITNPDNEQLESKKENEKIVKEGKNFKIINIGSNDDRKYKYFIFNLEHKIVKEDIFERVEPKITYIEKDLIEMLFSGGTNALTYQYYDVVNDRFSQYFSNPSLVHNHLIIYMYGVDTDIKLVIQNIFDVKQFYKEIKRDFSPNAVASNVLIEAKFLEDNKLFIKYNKGKDFNVKSEIIELSKQ